MEKEVVEKEAVAKPAEQAVADKVADEAVPHAAEVLSVPYPGVEPVAAEQQLSEQEMQDLLQTPRMLQLRERYRDPAQQAEIAREFLSWVKEQPAEKSVLLHAEDGVDYWFAGDIHASFEVLLRAFALVSERARSRERRAYFVMLGDIIDRGDEDLPCLAMVEDWLMRGEIDGVRLLCLQGNHDVALRYSRYFYSQVVPAELAELLNELCCRTEMYDDVEQQGKAAIELAGSRPVMAEITDLGAGPQGGSILLVHAGVPHTDLQSDANDAIADFKVLESRPLHESVPAEKWEMWVDDFLWNRLRPGIPTISPVRGFAGNLMGTNDVNSYRRLHHKLTGRSICCMLRGHDHIPGGWCLYSYHPKYRVDAGEYVQRECTVLGINTMHAIGNPMLKRAVPMLAHWQRGAECVQLHCLMPK